MFSLRVPFVAQYPLPASKIFSYSGRGLSIFSYVISRNISKSENFESFLLQRYHDTYKWKNVYLPKWRMKNGMQYCISTLSRLAKFGRSFFSFRPFVITTVCQKKYNFLWKWMHQYFQFLPLFLWKWIPTTFFGKFLFKRDIRFCVFSLKMNSYYFFNSYFFFQKVGAGRGGIPLTHSMSTRGLRVKT